MNPIKLLICDVDGTLVNKNKELTENARQVLRKVKKNNILVGLASGRPLDEIENYHLKWNLGFNFDLLVGLNGCSLRDNLIHKNDMFALLETDWIKEIVYKLLEYGYKPWIYRDDYMMAMEDNERIRHVQKNNGKKIIFTNDPNELYRVKTAKVLCHIPAEKMQEVENKVAGWIPDYYQSYKSQATLLEFSNSLCSKGATTKFFCDNHSIKMDNVLAFGDSSNDNDLLKMAGLGICLSNGTDDTKHCADQVTQYTCEEDGFAYHMLNVIFPKLGIN